MADNMAFFIDTADVDYINKLWDKLGRYVSPQSVVGITTNPSALAKAGIDTIAKFEEHIPKLTDAVNSMRWDKDIRSRTDKGLLYVQAPNSQMSEEELVKWAIFVDKFNTDTCAIGLKIPHFSYALRLSSLPELRKLYLNVTGISDAATAIKAMSYNDIFFASVIPGRMEERGINAAEHLEYLAKMQFFRHQNIITGSMRTLEGLRRAIYYQTVPTIGTRVWDAIDAENKWEEFVSYWNEIYEVSDEPAPDYMPSVDTTENNLSYQFFNEMDRLGEPLYKDFQTK